MTYGPPNPQYPSGPNPQQPGSVPGAPQGNTLITKLTAPVGGASDKLFQAGIGLAVGSLILIVFSFLSWVSSDFEKGSFSVSGIGSISYDVPGASSEDIKRNTEMMEEYFNAPGVWTIVFGVLLLLCAALLILRKFQGIAAVAATVIGVATAITAVVFFSDPGSALIESGNGDTSLGADESRGYGLWLVLVGSLAALALGAYALALVLVPEKLGVASGPAGFAPQVGGFAPGAANYGQQPAQPNYGQQPPAAPNYGQQPGQSQGGFPPVPPQGAPGQQYPGQQPPQGYGPPPQH